MKKDTVKKLVDIKLKRPGLRLEPPRLVRANSAFEKAKVGKQ